MLFLHVGTVRRSVEEIPKTSSTRKEVIKVEIQRASGGPPQRTGWDFAFCHTGCGYLYWGGTNTANSSAHS